ncbi:hypothetical protein K8S19_08810 [bacterium]|nr:hypothetical protein [bacterium]
MKRKCILVMILMLGLTVSPGPVFGAVELDHYYTAAQKLTAYYPQTPAGRLQDLELYWLALTLDALGQSDRSEQYLQYLQEYYPKSPLQNILPEIPEDTPYLPHFDLDPEISRLMKTAYHEIEQNRYGPETPAFSECIALLTLQIDAILQGDQAAGWERFLEKYPESEYSGWAAYQMAWQARHRETNTLTLLKDFWVSQKMHPLGLEAAEAMDVRFFSPEKLSFLSALLPGLGEETLEPGMRESSTVMYSELLFLAGTIGFAIAAQNNARIENLTGALIIGNFLILNHKGSADKAYVLAHRRNMAGQRKFQKDRIDKSVIGPAWVSQAAAKNDPAGSLDNELILSLNYQTESIGSGLRGKGYVNDNNLVNLGFRAEYLATLLTLLSGPHLDISLGVVPFARLYINAAEKQSESGLDKGLYIQEYSMGAELAWLTRWSFQESFLQLRISGGPAFRVRTFSLDQAEFDDKKLVPAVTLALDWGGLSGSYWHAAVFYETGTTEASLQLDADTITLPSKSLGFIFGLGIHF